MSTIGIHAPGRFRWLALALLGLVLLAPLDSQISAQESDSPPAAVEKRIESGARVIEVTETDRFIKIVDDPKQGITVEITETKDGTPITTLIEAKNPSELEEKNAEAFHLWWDYAADWRDKIDISFGKYMVTPMEKVIFFDFWTEDWLGSKVPFIVFWLLAGATFFTIRMGFFNIRGFKHAIQLTRGDYDKPDETGEVSHFQALSSALSATVGLGNIAGVAIAIGMGGPGACFWMIVIGFLGMSSKFTECTLGQMYRKVDENGTVSGGAMHYLKDGLADIGVPRLGKFLAVFFAVLCIAASLGGG
ncbi:MAG: alanine:cation symporter family protein, partial [Pirellulaceae bacterium]